MYKYLFLLTVLLMSCSSSQESREAYEKSMSDWCKKADLATGEQHVWILRHCAKCKSIQGIEALRKKSNDHLSFVGSHLIGTKFVGDTWKLEHQGSQYHSCKHDWIGDKLDGRISAPAESYPGR